MSVKVIRFAPGLRPVFKHQEHDQSSHGNWADSGSPKLTIMGQNDGTNEFFNENTRVVRYQPKGEEPVDYVIFNSGQSEIFAFKKPTDGTTINGYGYGPNSPKPVARLDVAGPGATAYRSSASKDNNATIAGVVVNASHRRRGLASAMLRFHRDMYPKLNVQHSDALLDDGKAWSDVVKHESHDQATHGSWANGTSESSLISTDTQIAFNEGAIKATDNILSPSAYQSQLEGNLNRTYPKTYLEEAVNNSTYQDALQTHLKSIGFPETVKVFSSSAQKGEYFHGSVAPLWDSGAVGYESEESPKEFSVNRSDIIGLGKVADSGVWFRNSKAVKKHQEHDQKTHGNWATGISSELETWNPKDPVPASPRNATGTTDKFWENWEHGVDGDQFVDLYRQYAGEMLGLPVPKSDKDVGGSENYLTQRGFGASSTGAVRNQTEAVLTAIANGRPQPTLYRGMAGSDAESKALLEQFTNLKEGDTIDMPLVSTTRSLGVAQWYAADRSYTPSDTKVILKIQEGAKGVSVKPEKSFYPSDFETITSGKFQVVGISTLTTPYWARGAVSARTFKLNRPGEDLVTGYRYQDPNDLSWDRKESNDPAAKVRYDIIRDGAITGNFSKIETPTLKYTNDRQTRPIKDGQDITVNSWTRKEPTTFTVIEVKLVEPHVVRKAESKDYGLTFDALFNNIPFIREEDIAKHESHDQKTHGSWATGGAGVNITDELDTVFFNGKLNIEPSRIFPSQPDIPIRSEIERVGLNKETVDLIDKMSEEQIASGQAYGDNALRIIAERQGFADKPKVVETFEDLQKLQRTEGGMLVFRGVTDYSREIIEINARHSRAENDGGAPYKSIPQILREGKEIEAASTTYTADQVLRDFREGEYFGGWGVFGNGTYTTVRIDEAGTYAWNKDLDNGKVGNGKIMAMLIPKNAKAPSKEMVKLVVKEMVYGGEPNHRNNVGRRLASMGYQYYDAGFVQNDKGGVFVVLDRSMLTVAEKAVG